MALILRHHIPSIAYYVPYTLYFVLHMCVYIYTHIDFESSEIASPDCGGADQEGGEADPSLVGSFRGDLG